MSFSFFKRSNAKAAGGKSGESKLLSHGFTNEQLRRIQALAHERLQRAEDIAARSLSLDTSDVSVNS